MCKNKVISYFFINSTSTSTIVFHMNSPILFSPKWPIIIENLERGMPLKSFDAIVLGKFNRYFNSMDEAFNRTISKVLQDVPGQIDFSKTSGPSLRDVASIYEGPVVYVGMFALYAKSEQEANLNFVKSVASTRDNLSVIDGRKYINQMKMECGADDMGQGVCFEKKDEATKNLSRRVNGMHRCTGDKGGHPDLIAWEVAEKLNRL